MTEPIDDRLLTPAPEDPALGEIDRDEGEIGLCLSGGGYRAMLFHLGALWRLNELGYLPRIDRVSSVSGGSIIAGILALTWEELEFDGSGVSPRFHDLVARRIHEVASRSLDWKAILAGALLPGSSVGWHLTWLYRKNIFGAATLQDLPDESRPANPHFIFNATNLQSGVLWRFSRPWSWDYRVGQIERPELSIAKVVAASSAFPPFLSPARFRFREADFAPNTGEGLQQRPYTTKPVLSDGGVYDNLGLQPLWNGFKTILISDGGGALEPSEGAIWRLRSWRWRDWGTQAVRVLAVIDNQVRNLRKRQAIESFRAAEDDPHHRDGTYWGIRSHVADYQLPSSLDCPPESTKPLAQTKTRLKGLDETRQKRIVNWGYGICDTAMRKWVERSQPRPEGFPYPDAGL